MNKLIIFDPTQTDKIGAFRGGGRIIQLLKENLPEAQLIDFESNFFPKTYSDNDSILLIPIWNPFLPPINFNNLKVNKKYLIIFDTIPLKYPDRFPIGLKGKFNLWRNKKNLKIFDKIITISKTSKKDIVRYLQIPENKIEVVYPCLAKNFLQSQKVKVKRQKLNPKVKIEDSLTNKYSILNTNYCVYVGDVNWNKNLVNLAKAIKIANVTCVFIGQQFDKKTRNKIKETNKVHPWLQEYKQFVNEVNNDKRFIFFNYISDNKLVQLYKHATCNLLLSRDEGFGMSYIEAGSQNCPSILSDIPIFQETACKNALFTNPDNPQSIANAIKKMFDDKNFRSQLGLKTKKYVLNKYSPNKFRSELLKILDF